MKSPEKPGDPAAFSATYERWLEKNSAEELELRNKLLRGWREATESGNDDVRISALLFAAKLRLPEGQPLIWAAIDSPMPAIKMIAMECLLMYVATPGTEVLPEPIVDKVWAYLLDVRNQSRILAFIVLERIRRLEGDSRLRLLEDDSDDQVRSLTVRYLKDIR